MFGLLKVSEILAQPLNLLLLALLAASALRLKGRERAGWRVLTAGALAVVLAGLLPWGGWLVTPLENRFPFPARLPERVDGIIVLGGAVNPVLSIERGQPSVNGSAERLFGMVELARRYPSAKLLYSGGSGSLSRQDLKEAPVARDLLDRLGFDTSRVIFEGQSRNTRENAVLSRALAQPRPGEVWLLVTSASHMPRSVGVFRAVGWPVLAYPVDYQTSVHAREYGNGLAALSLALHEWLGLAYYSWRGWCESWFPAP